MSAREAEVIALIAQGLSNEEIAGRIYLSTNTVKTYIRSAYRKLGVDSRIRAVLWAIDHGFRPDTLLAKAPAKQDRPVRRSAKEPALATRRRPA